MSWHQATIRFGSGYRVGKNTIIEYSATSLHPVNALGLATVDGEMYWEFENYAGKLKIEYALLIMITL